MVKDVLFGEEGREKLKVGVDTLANSVKVTLGPKGRNVIIDKNFTTPHITKDGVTVAQDITLNDRIENMGCTMVKNIARKTATEAGDGTTTATVLAQAIFNKGLKALTDNVNPIDLKRGMDRAVAGITTAIKGLSQPVKDNVIEVATISANGDEEIGGLVNEVIDAVGGEGTITVEDSPNHETWYEVVEGQKYDSGYVSPYFVTNIEKQTSELKNPYILITNEKITSFSVIQAFAQACHDEHRPILIVCEEMGGEALHKLLANVSQLGLKACVTFAPAFAGQRVALLEDMAISTGATLIGDAYGRPFHHMNPRSNSKAMSALGTADRVIIDRTGTVIINGNSTKEALTQRVKEIKAHREMESNEQVKEKFSERIARLEGGVAVLHVGGFSETEVNEKKDRIDDAICAVRAALEEGVVPGGGFAYLTILDTVEKIGYENEDERLGGEIVFEAIKEPFKQIAENAGKNPEFILEHLTSLDAGYNFRTDEYVDLVEDGVIDPAKVTRVALENAVSVSGLLLTTECVVYNKLTDFDIAQLASGANMNKHK